MCVLFGWLDIKGIFSHKVLKKLTQKLVNVAEERGTDASGISYVMKIWTTIQSIAEGCFDGKKR